MHDATAIDVTQRISKELETLAPVHPRSFLISYRAIQNNDNGCLFMILMHRLATERNGYIQMIEGAKWWFSMLDLGVWDEAFGRAATIMHIQDTVHSIRKYIKNAKPIDIN